MSMLLETIKGLDKVQPDWDPPTATAVSHRERIGIVLVPKCGSTSLEAALESAGCFEPDEGIRPTYRYAAMVREPVDRWASGFATWVAANAHDGAVGDEEAKQFLGDPDVRNYVLARLVFDRHTAPQCWYLAPFLAQVTLFDVDNRRPFYAWCADRGCPLEEHDLHRTADFEEGSVHKTVWLQASALVARVPVGDRIANYYQKDMRLYRRARHGND
jgi:hypothetical protein